LISADVIASNIGAENSSQRLMNLLRSAITSTGALPNEMQDFKNMTGARSGGTITVFSFEPFSGDSYSFAHSENACSSLRHKDHKNIPFSML
jgi:hypothetical protein